MSFDQERQKNKLNKQIAYMAGLTQGYRDSDINAMMADPDLETAYTRGKKEFTVLGGNKEEIISRIEDYFSTWDSDYAHRAGFACKILGQICPIPDVDSQRIQKLRQEWFAGERSAEKRLRYGSTPSDYSDYGYQHIMLMRGPKPSDTQGFRASSASEDDRPLTRFGSVGARRAAATSPNNNDSKVDLPPQKKMATFFHKPVTEPKTTAPDQSTTKQASDLTDIYGTKVKTPTSVVHRAKPDNPNMKYRDKSRNFHDFTESKKRSG